MNKFIIALIAVAGTSAYAATTTTTTAPTATVAPAAATTTVSAPTASVAPTRKIKLNYTAENAAEVRSMNTGKPGAIESLQHVGIAYQIDANRKIQYRQYFMYNSSDLTKTNEWDMGDLAFQYTDSQAFNFGATPVQGYARLYVPASDYTTEIGKYELRLVGAVEKALPNKFTFEAALSTRLYAYTGNDDGQRGLRILPSIQVSRANVLPGVTPFIGAYTDNSWYHSGTGLGYYNTPGSNPEDVRNHFWSSIGVNTKPSASTFVNFYVETMDDLRKNDDYVLFDDKTSIYYLDLGVTL